MTSEHVHQCGQWSPWTKVAFDRWHRQRDCECGMVEDDSTSNPRVAGEPPPSGTSYKDDEDDEEEYKAELEKQSQARPHVEDMSFRTAYDSSADKLLDKESEVHLPDSLNLLDGDALNTAYIKAIETVRLIKKAIDDREATRAKFSELVHEMGSPG